MGNRVENQQKQVKLLKHQIANLSEFIIRLSKVYDGAFPDIDGPLHTLRSQLKSPSTWLQAETTMSELTGPILKNVDALRSFNHKAVSQLESAASQILNDSNSSIEIKQRLNQFISEISSSNLSLETVITHLQSGIHLFMLIDESRGKTSESAPKINDVTQQLHNKITEEFKELVGQLIASEQDKA